MKPLRAWGAVTGGVLAALAVNLCGWCSSAVLDACMPSRRATDVLETARSARMAHLAAWNAISAWQKSQVEELHDRMRPSDDALIERTEGVLLVDRGTDSRLMRSALAYTNGSSSFLGLCTAINPRYCFELTKENLESHWKVAKVHTLGKEEPDLGKLSFWNPLTRPSRQTQSGCPSYGVIGLGGAVLIGVEMFQKPETFVLESARWTDEGHAELHFIHHHPELLAGPWAEGKHRPAPVKSRLVLARDQEFMPLEFVQTASVNGLEHEYRVTCERQLKDRLPTTERVSRRWIIREGGELRQDTETIVTSSFTYGPIPVSQFTLSAYGFPEPFGIEWERPTPWWLYALISAGVLFIVTVIVSFWKRRLAARSAA